MLIYQASRRIFSRDAGCILAEAGRGSRGNKAIEENLKRFPNDIWVVINAGDAMWSLDKIKLAEEFFQRHIKWQQRNTRNMVSLSG